MEHIKLESLPMMSYPVGEFMDRNILLIEEMSKVIIDNYGGDNINLWCRGSSGAIIAALICNKFISQTGGKCKIAHVKKEGESSHHSTPTYNSSYKNIIVDDFIASGRTVIAILQEMLNYLVQPKVTIVVTGTISSDTTEFLHEEYGIEKIYSR